MTSKTPVTAAQMRRLDARAIHHYGIPSFVLMDHARRGRYWNFALYPHSKPTVGSAGRAYDCTLIPSFACADVIPKTG